MSKNISKDSEIQLSGNFNKLCTGTKITGTIFAATDFRIDGDVDGNIECKGKIVIGDKAKIKGEILSKNMDIHGTVEGTIHIEEILCLKGTAIVSGEIFVRKLIIELGAVFNGTCKVSDSVPVSIDNRSATVQK